MGQPTPPGNSPLHEGLSAEWNDVVSAFPEDRRSELANTLKTRIDAYEPYKQWDDLQKSGITPDQARDALHIRASIENNPRGVYDVLAQHLGITQQQAEDLVEEIEEGDSDDPRIAHLQNQIETMSQIMLAQRNQTVQEQEAAAEDAKLDRELNDLKKKYSDVDEEQVVMRMLSKGLTAEQAYQEHTEYVTGVRKTRPAPMLLGSGGSIPKPSIDVTKLSSGDTKSLVAQMMQQSLDEGRR